MSREDHRKYDAALQLLRQQQKSMAQKREGISSGDIALWCLAAFMTLGLLLVAPKVGRGVTLIVLIAMVGCLVHPIWQLPAVRHAKSSYTKSFRFVGLMVFATSLITAFGIYVWPPLPYYKTLTVELRENFMNVLKAQKDPKETLIIQCPASNEELCTVATDYLEMFQRAGWKTPSGGIARGSYLKSFPGVSVGKKPQPGNVDPNYPVHGLWVFQSPSIVTVKNAFRAVDIIPNEKADRNLPEDTISIYFGPEPKPQ